MGQRWIAALAGVAAWTAAQAVADEALRTRADERRGRMYVLEGEGVRVLDGKTRATLARVALPGWLWVRAPYACAPDLAIGPDGEAVVTSNVVGVLWRVDGRTLQVRRRSPTLWEDADKEIGFTRLEWSAAQNAFFATDDRGSMWRIDPHLERAQKLPRRASGAYLRERACPR